MFKTPPRTKKSDLEYSCKLCSEPDNNRMVFCEDCKNWFHYDCVGVDESIENSQVPWNCNDCETSKSTAAPQHNTTLPSRTELLTVATTTPISREHIVKSFTGSISRTTGQFQKSQPRSNIQTCTICYNIVMIPHDEIWSGICSDCKNTQKRTREVATSKLLSGSIAAPQKGQSSTKLPLFGQENMCTSCMKLFEVDNSEQGRQKKLCPRCENSIGRKATNKTSQQQSIFGGVHLETNSQSSTGSTRRRRELALKRLEEEKRLQMEYIEKKYSILDDSGSDDDINVDGGEQDEKRTEDWINNQNKHIFEEALQSTRRTVHFDQQEQNPPRTRSMFTSTSIPTHSRMIHNQPISGATFTHSSQANTNQISQQTAILTKSQIASRQSIGKEAVKFSGLPEDWPKFINFFEESTRLCNFSDGENLLRLQKCLEGEAEEAVRHRLYTPGAVQGILATLRMLFGRPQMIINRLLGKIRKFPPVNQDKLNELVKYSLSLQNLCATMESTGLRSHLNNPQLLLELLGKLPVTYKMDWSKYKRINGLTDENVTMASMSNWLLTLAEDASEYNDFGITTPAPDNPSKNKKIVNAHVDSSSSESSSIENCCTMRNGNSTCKRFKQLSLRDRWNIVKENKLCGKCLEQHDFKFCNVNKRCGTNGCTAGHHPLLHNFKKDSIDWLGHSNVHQYEDEEQRETAGDEVQDSGDED